MAGKVKGITIEIGGDTTGLSKALSNVNKETNAIQRELKDVEKALKLDPKNTELLAQKQKYLSQQIELTESKVEALKDAKNRADKAMADGTELNEKLYESFAREIAKTESQLKRLNDEADNVSKSNENAFGNVSIGKLTKFGKTVGVVTAAVGAAAIGLSNIEEETREFREDLNKLDTAFKSSNKTFKQGRDIYNDFYGILGESDRAVEAVNHLAELTNNQAELSQWTTIAAGVNAKFTDSLPIEGLTEAANETAKCGQVTGVLADALNWVAGLEDEVNEKLATLNTEEERSAYITETLSGLYSELGAQYLETNSSIIAVRESQGQWNEEMARLGEVVAPIKASIIEFGADAVGVFADIMENVAGVNNESAMLSNSIKEQSESWATFKETQEEKLEVDLAQIAYTQQLADELDLLIDAEGRVDKKNRARAEFIMGELNAALGTEMRLVGNVAQNYDNAGIAIDNLIAKKNAQIILESKEEGYKKAVLEMGQAEQNLYKAIAAEKEQLTKVQNLENQVAETQNASLARQLTLERDTLNVLSQRRSTSQATYSALCKDMTEYQRIVEVVTSGTTEDINAMVANVTSGVEASGSGTEEILLQNVEVAGTIYAELLKQVEEGTKKMTDADVQEAKRHYETALAEYEKTGKAIPEGLKKGVEVNAEQFYTSLRTLVANAKEIVAGAQGFDVNSPSKWGKKIGKSLDEGVAGGVDENKDLVLKSTKGLVDETKKAFTGKDGFDIHSPSIFGEDVGYNLIAGIPIGIDKAKILVDESLDSLISDTKEKLEDGMDTIADTKSSPFSETMLARAQRLGTTIEEVKSKGLSEEIRFFASSMDEAEKILNFVRDFKEAGKDVSVQFREHFNDAGTLVDKWVEVIDDKGNVFWRKQQKAVTKATQGMLEREGNYFLLKERLQNGFYDKYDEEHKKTMESYLERDRKFIEEERKLYGIQIENFNDLGKSNEELIEKKKEKLDELKQKVVETYKSIAEEALSSIDEINKAQESFEKKLSDYGHLYETVTINTGDEVIKYGKLADLSAQQKELEEYYDILMKVKERGSLPNDFFAMLRDMSIEEGMFYANALLGASDEEFNKYLSDYEEKQKKEKELSKLIYQDDAEILGQEITSSFEKFESEFFGIGGESAYGFGEGFIEEWNVAKENVQSAIAGAFASLFTNPVVEEKVTSEMPELFEDGMDEAAQDTLLMLEELSTDFLNIGQIWGTYVGKGFMEQFKNTLTSLKTSVDVEGYGAKTMVFQTQINQDITATPQTAFETSEQTRRVMENLMGQAVLA